MKAAFPQKRPYGAADGLGHVSLGGRRRNSRPAFLVSAVALLLKEAFSILLVVLPTIYLLTYSAIHFHTVCLSLSVLSDLLLGLTSTNKKYYI